MGHWVKPLQLNHKDRPQHKLNRNQPSKLLNLSATNLQYPSPGTSEAARFIFFFPFTKYFVRFRAHHAYFFVRGSPVNGNHSATLGQHYPTSSRSPCIQVQPALSVALMDYFGRKLASTNSIISHHITNILICDIILFLDAPTLLELITASRLFPAQWNTTHPWVFKTEPMGALLV